MIASKTFQNYSGITSSNPVLKDVGLVNHLLGGHEP
jgi:hypothetical protein